MKQKVSKKLFSEAQVFLPGGVDSPVRAFHAVGGYPPFIRRGLGPRLYDEDGNELPPSLLSVYGVTGHDGPPNAFGKSYDADTNGNTIADGREMDFTGLAGPGSGPDGGISGFDSSYLSSQGGDSCVAPP